MIPINSPWWLEELPESLTEAEYRSPGEEVSRTIEIVHGHVIRCESPAPQHNLVARRLSFALESARLPAGPCLRVETEVDLVLWRVPRFTFRRPDVIVYAVHLSVLDLEEPVRLRLPVSDLVAP
jgi:hypothetical protein